MKDKVDSRHNLDGYIFSIKSTISGKEAGVADKLEPEDKKTIETTVQEAEDWLTQNTEADGDAIREKLAEIEGVINPIIGKIYQQAGGAGGAAPGAGEGGADDDFGHDEL